MNNQIIACEDTESGWRGLTAYGQILNVAARDGEPPPVMPEGEFYLPNGEHYALPPKQQGSVTRYLEHTAAAFAAMRQTDFATALVEIDGAMKIAPTTCARFVRALVLLSRGEWKEGLRSYDFTTIAQPTGIPRWQGEDISGKRILLTHDHGFGDTIMCLRYIPMVEALGAHVTMLMPPELARLAAQVGTVTANSPHLVEADRYCSMIGLLHLLAQTPDTIPIGVPYLNPERARVEYWQRRLGNGAPKIGIAWTAGNQSDTDYPRSAPLAAFVDGLRGRGDLVSVQKQGRAEAMRAGVAIYELADFADCAALMAACNEIVSIDTAALHLAGAIGHPHVYGMLSHWHSWRWLAPWYPQVRLCRQTAPDDWASAFAQIEPLGPTGPTGPMCPIAASDHRH
jgi:hypothetical protein